MSRSMTSLCTIGLGALLSMTAAAQSAATPPPLVIILMENKSARQIVDNDSAPFMNAFIGRGVRFTNYEEGESKGPSLPDYLQLAAGSSCGRHDDSVEPGDEGISSRCTTTLWNQLESAGRSWAVYMEGMPAPCSPAVKYDDADSGGSYVLKHNPATPFKSIYDDKALCEGHVLPFSSFDPTRLPDVSFVSPNVCNDMHGSGSEKWTDCESHTPALIERGDRWLAERVPEMLANGAQVFITFDESRTLYAVAAGPGLRAGTTDDTPYTHYSTLAAIEERFGLPKLGAASTAKALPLNSFPAAPAQRAGAEATGTSAPR